MNEQPNNGNIIFYQIENGNLRIEVTFQKPPFPKWRFRYI